MVNREKLKKRVHAAAKRTPADLVIKNGQIVDVFNSDLIRGDVAVLDGVIVGIGTYEGRREIDARGQYVCPGIIDGHVHIEASLFSC